MKSLILIFSIYSMSTFASNIHGVLMIVKGKVHVISSKDSIPKQAKVGTKVFPGDTISTDNEARAKLVMVDKNIINISPNSKFLLEKYEYDEKQNKKGAVLNVLYGKVRATVTQKYDNDENKFQVKTKSSVAGVRGTDFLVSYSQTTDTTKVITFEGLVEVGNGLNSNGQIMNPIQVEPGKFTVATSQVPPSLPVSIPDVEFKDLQSQSLAEQPSESLNDRSPSQNTNEKNDKKNERDPQSSNPQNPNPQPVSNNSVLNEMGESIVAPPPGQANLPPPPMMVPTMNPPTAACPNGQCVPLNTLDPNVIGGRTRLLINITPSP